MSADRCTVWDDLTIHRGQLADWRALQHFHYRSASVGVAKRVFTGRYHGPGLGLRAARDGIIAGVLVEALPRLACAARDRALGGRYSTGERSRDAVRLNREVRTIARVIVHPMFRGIGLGAALVRHALAHAETPYVEALAAMGRVNPVFERAGMRRCEVPGDMAGRAASRPVYYLWEKGVNAAAGK